jgi:hypothetical protein
MNIEWGVDPTAHGYRPWAACTIGIRRVKVTLYNNIVKDRAVAEKTAQDFKDWLKTEVIK